MTEPELRRNASVHREHALALHDRARAARSTALKDMLLTAARTRELLAEMREIQADTLAQERI